MTQAIGDIVEINGNFVVIDHDLGSEHEYKKIAEVVCVYSSEKKRREAEIHTIVHSFASGSGGHLRAGETDISFSGICRSNSSNDKMLKNHPEEGINKVIIYNRETGEFILLMNEVVSIKEAREFIWKVNKQESELLRDKIAGEYYQKYLSLPKETGLGKLRVAGNTRFEVVVNSGIIAIVLEKR